MELKKSPPPPPKEKETPFLPTSVPTLKSRSRLPQVEIQDGVRVEGSGDTGTGVGPSLPQGILRLERPVGSDRVPGLWGVQKLRPPSDSSFPTPPPLPRTHRFLTSRFTLYSSSSTSGLVFQGQKCVYRPCYFQSPLLPPPQPPLVSWSPPPRLSSTVQSS